MATDVKGLLFCPFCEECFEGETRCPDHDLPLVDLDALAKARGRTAVTDDVPVAVYEPRHGRGVVFFGSLTVLVGFFFPFVRTTYPQAAAVVWTGMQTAATAALNLWIVPAVAATLVSVLARRRTPARMRGARLAVVLLVGVAGGSVAYTVSRIHRGAALFESRAGQPMEVILMPGAWVMVAGLVIAAVGGLRLGAVTQASPSYRTE